MFAGLCYISVLWLLISADTITCMYFYCSVFPPTKGNKWFYLHIYCVTKIFVYNFFLNVLPVLSFPLVEFGFFSLLQFCASCSLPVFLYIHLISCCKPCFFYCGFVFFSFVGAALHNKHENCILYATLIWIIHIDFILFFFSYFVACLLGDTNIFIVSHGSTNATHWPIGCRGGGVRWNSGWSCAGMNVLFFMALAVITTTFVHKSNEFHLFD